MSKVKSFPCFIGIQSLSEVATPENKVCVMNILGNESSKVTPVSHVFSGGNVVAGVQYGRQEYMQTDIGEIPVYSRLADVVEKHEFDTAVVYLPPQAVYHAVAELCHYNKDLKKIVIITEKISVKDQRLIRALCQANRIDVFGANSLGVADSWNQIRIGGGLGGDRPEETLVKGSVAIHSNSGNFSTTIAEYLKTEGFGTTVVISSGKDVIIQFGVVEFLYAAQNDERTKAVILYVEPGGYYEKVALDWIRSGRLDFDKPMVVCVTGRWKSKLTTSVGHAGALAGDNDNAMAKEQWFDDYFGTGVFDLEHPEKVSEKGVRVRSIQHIPQALKAVYEKNKMQADFEPAGDLHLKPWFGNDFGLQLPAHLKLPVVEAIAPYNEEIRNVNKQLGARFFKQAMRNASGASRINPKTLIAELHGKPITELIDNPFESNMLYAVLKRFPDNDEIPLLNLCLNYFCKTEPVYFEIVKKARANNATPNEALMAAVSLMGNNEQQRNCSTYMTGFISLFSELAVRERKSKIDRDRALELAKRNFKEEVRIVSGLTGFLRKVIERNKPGSSVFEIAYEYLNTNPNVNIDLFIISSILFHLAFPSLVSKKVSKETVVNLPVYLDIESKMTILAGSHDDGDPFFKRLFERNETELLDTSFSEIAFRAIFGFEPANDQMKEFEALLALTLTNGPGTISAKGAKESVSARNHISTVYAGFMANTGFAHGGNGFEAVAFLLESFKDVKIDDPGIVPDADILDGIALKAARIYKAYKESAKSKGEPYKRIPCINHPVFKGKEVNIDPREAFVYKEFKAQGIDNAFWDFYHRLVQALFETGVSENIYCVNIDAVIAVITLKLIWAAYKDKRISDAEIQQIGFVIFLLGRMAGVSAEIADHMDRGQDMDCRTPTSALRFIV